MRSLARGGGWISIPVDAGSGVLHTDTIPTLGLRLDGCASVWSGHSGVWTLEVTDPLNGGRLEATALPGEGIPFSYRTGRRSSLEVHVRWSEPRDTTLLMWVGLGSGKEGRRDPCDPVYDGGPSRPLAIHSP